MTENEIAYVTEIWNRMPGHTCFYDALCRILRDEIPKQGEWKEIGKAKIYTFWQRLEPGATVYNVTTDGKPPKNEAGYFELEYLKKIKNVSF
jgi:hypothetical protein